MEINKLFALKVRELRLQNKMSQETLAHCAGLDRTYLQSIEKGDRNVSLQTIYKLAVALKIEIKDFFI